MAPENRSGEQADQPAQVLPLRWPRGVEALDPVKHRVILAVVYWFFDFNMFFQIPQRIPVKKLPHTNT